MRKVSSFPLAILGSFVFFLLWLAVVALLGNQLCGLSAHSFAWTAPLRVGAVVGIPRTTAEAATPTTKNRTLLGVPPALSATTDSIDYQSDAPTFGRGEYHLSAVVEEGDTVVYRTGSWYVDGVLVGDAGEGAAPSYELCRIDTIQVVWTHNCEHGVLRGLAVGADTDAGENCGSSVLFLKEPLEDVEFGPEQLIARIRGVEWRKSVGEGEFGTCPVSLHESMWKENDANAIYD